MKIATRRENRSEILSNLARSMGKRIGVEMKPFEFAPIADRSGAVHWMYRFDEHRIRIFPVQHGSQVFRDIPVDKHTAIDVDEMADEIQQAVVEMEKRFA